MLPYSFLLVPLIGCDFLNMETDSFLEKLVDRYRYQHTKGVCPFITYFVTEMEIVFRDLIFWRILFIYR